jgi:uncharacterized protein (TIGR02646 family)
MLYIQKNEEPEKVATWKRKFKKRMHRHPNYEDIRQESEKQILQTGLIEEQKYLCCYCCNRISKENSHIEHFVPQHMDMSLSLEYRNLHASCDGEDGNRRHCGHKKDRDYDENKLISPLDPQCESRFRYTVAGKVIPAFPEDEAAQYTIDTLALNEERLKSARCEAMWEAGVFTVQDDEERERLITLYSDIERSERPPFCDAILYQLRKDCRNA